MNFNHIDNNGEKIKVIFICSNASVGEIDVQDLTAEIKSDLNLPARDELVTQGPTDLPHLFWSEDRVGKKSKVSLAHFRSGSSFQLICINNKIEKIKTS